MKRAAIGLLTLALLAACSPRPMPPNVIPPNTEAATDGHAAAPAPARP